MINHPTSFMVFCYAESNLFCTLLHLSIYLNPLQAQCSLVPRPRPAFPAFPYCKWWKAGRGLGTRLPSLLSPLPYMEKGQEWGWGSNPMTSHDVILWHPMKVITDLGMHTWCWWWQNASLTTKIDHIYSHHQQDVCRTAHMMLMMKYYITNHKNRSYFSHHPRSEQNYIP